MFDVDGVFADFVQGFYTLARKFDPNIPYHNTFTQVDWHNWVGISTDIENKCWEQIKADPLWWTTLRACFDTSDLFTFQKFYDACPVSIYFVTSRPGLRAQEQTSWWLRNYLQRDCSVVTVGSGLRKASFAELLDVRWSIEDNHPNARVIWEIVHNSYLIDRLYNQKAFPKRIKRVSEFCDIIRKEEKW